MKRTTVLCTLLAGSLGFGTLASAQQIRIDNGQPHAQQRHERRADRLQQRQDRQDRQQRRAQRQERQHRQLERQQDRVAQQRWNNAVRRGVYPGYIGGGITNTQENCERYWNCATNPQFHRGGYLPQSYLAPNYYISNWSAYPGLYAPPAGYQWVNVGSDYMLVSLANGLIANLLTQ